MRNTTPTRVLGIRPRGVALRTAPRWCSCSRAEGCCGSWTPSPSDGYFATRTHQYATPTRALRHAGPRLRRRPSSTLPPSRRRAHPARPRRLHRHRPAREGRRVPRRRSTTKIADLDFSPFDVPLPPPRRLARAGGARAPGLLGPPPTATGGRTLSWRVRSGHWSVVVMNAGRLARRARRRARRGQVPLLHRLAVWMLIGGGVFALLGAGLLMLAAKPRSAVLAAV